MATMFAALRHLSMFLLIAGGSATASAQSQPDEPPQSAQRHSRPPVDHDPLLYMQADQLTYDTQNNRIIAQGMVEIYYNNYIVTADQVTYDENTNELVADGHAQIKDPNGAITRAERLLLIDEFRDAFRRSLAWLIAEQKRQ